MSEFIDIRVMLDAGDLVTFVQRMLTDAERARLMLGNGYIAIGRAGFEFMPMPVYCMFETLRDQVQNVVLFIDNPKIGWVRNDQIAIWRRKQGAEPSLPLALLADQKAIFYLNERLRECLEDEAARGIHLYLHPARDTRDTLATA